MILVDSSVVIPFCKGKDLKLMGLLSTLPVAVCGVTEAEVLAGARTPGDRARFLAVLALFVPLPVPPTIWPRVGDHLAILYAAGLPTPLTDVTSATVAIDHGIECWARDKHFPAMAAHLPGLRLFAEPP